MNLILRSLLGLSSINFEAMSHMEPVFAVWILGVLPNLAKLLVLMGLVGITGWAICSVVMAAEGFGRLHKAWLFTPLVILVLGAALPTRETTYAMAAAYGVQAIVENEAANELASDGVDVLKAWMKKVKTELEQSTEGR